MKKLFLGLALAAAPFMFAQKVTGVTVERPKKEIPAELSKDKVKMFNENLIKFLAAVKVSDRKAIDALLSDKVKQIVTDDVLKKVKEGIDYDKKLEVLKAGYYVTADGEGYPNLKYKYAGDASNKEVISAVFEEDGKILGVMPAPANTK
ncbi:hypothetical protein [Chryseobacterium indologenes]|uniref:Peptidylprolyl isomerase n=1 Tax=Chryseobacterium indologenes TaxID=253 RepID=A0A0N0IW47_CHRID|nr:hypothetical protein [Chryseobacterium indologenes]KPE51093.1 peptidylprolyl isomerase [Chryseobacterium indologenes]